MMEEFWNELYEGDIHARDHLQFELKNEFAVRPDLTDNIFKQEFFLFIPNPLQINSETYSKEQFYQDQTNLIRYTTPTMSLTELIEPANNFSPLIRLQQLMTQEDFSLSAASDELKLLGNIFHVAMSEQVFELYHELNTHTLKMSAIPSFIQETQRVLLFFRDLLEKGHQRHSSALHRDFRYVDEYMSLSVNEFFLLLLKQMDESACADKQQLIQVIQQEENYRHVHHLEPQSKEKESILYRQGLLNRFMLEALMLKTHRQSLQDKQGDILGALAAGVAMFAYTLLFVWKISNFVINSFPFVFLAVVFYILKDRLKEWLKRIYFREAYRWFPDYSTNIIHDKKEIMGLLKENFAFIEPHQLPPHFLKLRQTCFHEELESLHRHETIIQYKRELILQRHGPFRVKRRQGLTTIFRLNIYQFLRKASNPFQPYLRLDETTQTVDSQPLPKVYHLNLIIRNTSVNGEEIKMFRVVVDKLGIKRVESIQKEKGYEG